MSEGAIVAVFALACTVDVRSTEFGLVLIRMIELLNPIVCLLATITLRAVPASSNVVAELRLVGTQRSSLVFFLIMIVWTPFQIMCVRGTSTGCYLE